MPPARSAARLWMRRPRGGCFRKGKAGQRMVAVVLHHPKKRGKTYRVAEEADVHVFSEAEGHLEEKRERLMLEWGMDPVPDEAMLGGRRDQITKS